MSHTNMSAQNADAASAASAYLAMASQPNSAATSPTDAASSTAVASAPPVPTRPASIQTAQSPSGLDQRASLATPHSPATATPNGSVSPRQSTFLGLSPNSTHQQQQRVNGSTLVTGTTTRTSANNAQSLLAAHSAAAHLSKAASPSAARSPGVASSISIPGATMNQRSKGAAQHSAASMYALAAAPATTGTSPHSLSVAPAATAATQPFHRQSSNASSLASPLAATDDASDTQSLSAFLGASPRNATDAPSDAALQRTQTRSSNSTSTAASASPTANQSVHPLQELMQRFGGEVHTDLTRVPTRRLLKEGALSRKASSFRGQAVHRYCMLFNDCLLLCEFGSKHHDTQSQLIQKQLMPLHSMIVQDKNTGGGTTPDSDSHNNKQATHFSVLTPDRKYEFIAATVDEKREWMQAIQAASRAHKLSLHQSSGKIGTEQDDAAAADPLALEDDHNLLSATLHSAVESRNDDALLRLLSDRDEQPDALNGEGCTALQLAVDMHSISAVSLLLAHGADASLRCLDGSTVLHRACRAHDFACILLLLVKGKADPNAEDAQGLTPFWLLCCRHVTVEGQEQQATERRRRQRKRREQTHKATAAAVRQSTMLSSAPVATPRDSDDQKSNHQSSESEDDDASDPASDNDETSAAAVTADAVHRAQQSLRDTLGLMLDSKASIDLTDPVTHLSLVDTLAVHDYDIALSVLLDRQLVNVNSVPDMTSAKSTQRTLLHICCNDGGRANSLRVVRLLLSRGAYANARDSLGNTALHLTRSLAVAGCLLVNGARPDLKNTSGGSIQRADHYFDVVMSSNSPPDKRKHIQDTLRNAIKTWSERGVTLCDEANLMSETDPAWLADSSVDQCLICAATFSFTQRRHHCKRDGLICCSACTTKRCTLTRGTDTQTQHRVCDGCYLLLCEKTARTSKARREQQAKKMARDNELAQAKAKYDADMAQSRIEHQRMKEFEERTLQEKHDRIEARQKAKEKEAAAVAAASSSSAHKSASASQQQQQSSQLHAQMSENRDLLHARGTKLSEMAEKAQTMQDDAENFADMAKRLKEKQKSRWF